MTSEGHNAGKNRRALPKRLPSAGALSRIFSYEPETGVLRWKRRHGDDPGVAIFNGTHAGKPAGSHHQGGYLQVSFMCDGTKIKALVHRICFLLHFGYEPHAVDHINNDRKDNRAVNLREAVGNGNQCNRSIVAARSRFKGVYTHHCTGKFFAQIVKKKKAIYLGIFENEVDAAAAYDTAARQFHGAFARTNKSLGLIGDQA